MRRPAKRGLGLWWLWLRHKERELGELHASGVFPAGPAATQLGNGVLSVRAQEGSSVARYEGVVGRGGVVRWESECMLTSCARAEWSMEDVVVGEDPQPLRALPA